MTKWLVMVAVGVLLTGGGGAGLCKYRLNCHLNSTPPVDLNDFDGTGGRTLKVPFDLQVTTVVSKLSFPTDFGFLPDGEVVIAERDGLIVVAKHGRIRPKPFLDLTGRVNVQFFRGLLGLTVDPDFEHHPYIYVLYAVVQDGAAPTKPTTVRVSRFRVVGGTAVLASERVLLGKADSRPCPDQSPTADCIPAQVDHIGGKIVGATDGTLFVSTGDGGGKESVEAVAFAAQNVDKLSGKILHIDREGNGLPDNPFWNGNEGANRSKVWAFGLRNPFRMTLVSSLAPALVVGDVGWRRWEELNRVGRGADLGWPCYEGTERTMGYRSTPFCHDYYKKTKLSSIAPWLALPHSAAQSITAGTLVPTTRWPKRYRGRYLFGDWATNSLSLVSLRSVRPSRSLDRLATQAGGPVSFAVGPDGAVYYLALNIGELRRIAPVSP